MNPAEFAKSESLGYRSVPPTPTSFQAAGNATQARVDREVPPAAAPLPKRPKGRLFIGTLLFSIFAWAGCYFIENCCRYVAYGEVVGRKIELSPPCEGVISTLHVRVGDVLRQGDPVFRIDRIELRHRMEQINDSLNLEQARLNAELARLRWEADRIEDAARLIQADYYEKWSELLWEQSVLADLTQQLRRAEQLQAREAIAFEQLQSLRLRVEGQNQRVDQLTKAVDSLKNALKNDRPVDRKLNEQLKPSFVQIENLQAELTRVRQLLDQGLVRCPANGRVTRVMKYSGEYVAGNAPVIELFVDGSSEIVLYVPQSKSQQWGVGDRISVRVDQTNQQCNCVVSRIEPQLRFAPESIKRHYNADELLMPIVIRPSDASVTEKLVLGSTVRLPRLSPLSSADPVVPVPDAPTVSADENVELFARYSSNRK